MSKQAAVAAAPLTFFEARDPVQPGQLRMMTWRLPIYTGNEHESTIWRDRINGYWERQERMYGMVVSKPMISTTVDRDAGPVISTYVTVLARVEGPRVPRHDKDAQQ